MLLVVSTYLAAANMFVTLRAWRKDHEGERIPLPARIFSVVDVWDALRSDRPYRPAWSHERAREYIVTERGRHFDPQVVDVFLSQVDEEMAF